MVFVRLLPGAGKLDDEAGVRLLLASASALSVHCNAPLRTRSRGALGCSDKADEAQTFPRWLLAALGLQLAVRERKRGVITAWRTLGPVGGHFLEGDRALISNTVDREGVLCIPLVNILKADERPRRGVASKVGAHVVEAHLRVRRRASDPNAARTSHKVSTRRHTRAHQHDRKRQQRAAH